MKAIICDIDGTLALMKDRGPFDWHLVGQDLVHSHIKEILSRFSEDYIILLVSGRDEVCRPQTEEWLAKHGIDWHFLFMRPKGSYEKDCLVKEKIFNEKIKGEWEVSFVLDDRDQVVKMWRSLGLIVLQVAEGNF